MKKFIITSIVILVFAMMPAHANTDKNIIYERMKAYADLVSCSNSFEDDGDIEKTKLSDIFFVGQEGSIIEYYVLWGGDMGCAGGSSSASAYVTSVYKYEHQNDKFYIGDNFAFGDIGINYRFIESIKQISQDKFIVTAWDFADEKFGGADGGNNFPANKFEYTIEKQDKFTWHITNQKLIEQNR